MRAGNSAHQRLPIIPETASSAISQEAVHNMTSISPSSPDGPSPGTPLDLRPTQPLPAIAPHRHHSFVTWGSAVRRRHHAQRFPGYLLASLLCLFALLNGADLASTYLGLSRGLSEGNPLMSALLSHFGFNGLIIYKLIVVAAVTEGALLLHVIDRRIAYATALICNVLVLAVVIANIVQYSLILVR